jgi:hypothetical protein
VQSRKAVALEVHHLREVLRTGAEMVHFRQARLPESRPWEYQKCHRCFCAAITLGV